MSDWGPGNPHPLSRVKTELVWEGKYDEYGNRREVNIAGCDLPLQKVEAIDEPRQNAEGKGQLELFKKQSRRQDDFRNRLIWGDNKLVMASLLQEFKGKIDLIYIDPPFDVGADFTMLMSLGDEGEPFHKEQSILESVAYRDTWGRGTDSYLHMMYERLILMRELLNETGSIYVHVGPFICNFVKMILDDIFGFQHAVSEIIWKRQQAHSDSSTFANLHDVIFFFTKTDQHKFNIQYIPYTDKHIQENYRYKDEKGIFGLGQMKAPHNRGPRYEWKGITRHWRYTKENMERLENENKLYYSENGIPWKKLYLEEMPGVVAGTIWADIHPVHAQDKEQRLDYATQKPEALLERIIKASSNEGDLVADFFCGSGTTGAVAEKLGRRWIMADLGRFAVHTSRKRMIEIQRQLYQEEKPYRAFDVYNLGRYERQWWQKERLAGAESEHRGIVLAFYRADVLTGSSSPYLHGRKGGAFVYVDGIDSILTLDEVKPIVEAAREAGGTEVHCLAWEFEMELKRNVEPLEGEYGVKVRLIRIPREVMEKNRRPGVDQIPFFEMATLLAKMLIKVEGGERIADVELTNFLPSLSEVPGKELEALKERAVKSGFDFIDFWAIDFDHRPGQPFKHHWQDYRLRKDRSLKTRSDCGHRYEDTRKHIICVKVIDVFGCDTSILLEAAGRK